jgi:hypothetical protein
MGLVGCAADGFAETEAGGESKESRLIGVTVKHWRWIVCGGGGVMKKGKRVVLGARKAV